MTREDMAARVAASRTSQGLPEKIGDPIALARAARILLAMRAPTSNASPKRAGVTTTPTLQGRGRRAES